MTVISEGEGEATEPVDNRARRALGAARGCSLDGLAGEESDEGLLLCGREPAALLQAQAAEPTDGTARAEGREPLEQCRGPLRGES